MVPDNVREAARRVQWSPNSGRADASILAEWVLSLPSPKHTPITSEWIAKNIKRLDQLTAECRRDTRKLERLLRHVQRKRAQIEAIKSSEEISETG